MKVFHPPILIQPNPFLHKQAQVFAQKTFFLIPWWKLNNQTSQRLFFPNYMEREERISALSNCSTNHKIQNVKIKITIRDLEYPGFYPQVRLTNFRCNCWHRENVSITFPLYLQEKRWVESELTMKSTQHFSPSWNFNKWYEILRSQYFYRRLY